MDWIVEGIVLTWGVTCLNVSPMDWQMPAYSSLRGYASQATWGLAMVVLGIARLTALYINGSMRRTPHTRMAGAFLTAFVWLQLSFAMATADAAAIAGIAIYPWLFLADIYNVYRAAQDAEMAASLA